AVFVGGAGEGVVLGGDGAGGGAGAGGGDEGGGLAADAPGDLEAFLLEGVDESLRGLLLVERRLRRVPDLLCEGGPALARLVQVGVGRALLRSSHGGGQQHRDGDSARSHGADLRARDTYQLEGCVVQRRCIGRPPP